MMRLGIRTIAAVSVLLSPSIAMGAAADTGRDMFVQYCSSCHGRDARGSGAVSPFLKVKVPDLTLLKKRSDGIYPVDRVMRVIDGRRTARVHGESLMPVWGEIFSAEAKDPKRSEVVTSQKVKTIADYMATLQR